MPQLSPTLREILDAYSREAWAAVDRLTAMAQDIDRLADSICPIAKVPTQELEEAA